MVEWEINHEEWKDHPSTKTLLGRRFTLKLKKKEDNKGKTRFVIDRILTPKFQEQNFLFMERLECHTD